MPDILHKVADTARGPDPAADPWDTKAITNGAQG